MTSAYLRASEKRLSDTLLGLITADQARLLLGLLDVSAGDRVSPLERLRKGQKDTTAKALVAALLRVAAVAGIGLGDVDLSVVPHRRVIELARYGRDAADGCVILTCPTTRNELVRLNPHSLGAQAILQQSPGT